MAEFLEDPSVLTKDKLKNELAANNVPLPSGEHKKEVYVQLYLKNLTVLNNKKSPPADTFSSDEEISAPVVSNKSRSGRVSVFFVFIYVDNCDMMLWSSVWIDGTSLSYTWLRSFLQKATKKTDKPRTEEVEVTDLTDEDLKQQLAKHGVDSGPIVGECCLRLLCKNMRNKIRFKIQRYKKILGITLHLLALLTDLTLKKQKMSCWPVILLY